MESQLLFILPFAAGYARQKKIRNLVLDKQLSHEIAKNEIIKHALSGFNIIYVGARGKKLWLLLKRLRDRACAINLHSIFMGFKVNRRLLIAQSEWHECQARHAVWDTAFHTSADGSQNLGLASRLMAANAVECNIRYARKLVNKYHVSNAIIGHIVYAGRALASELQRQGVTIVVQAASVLYKVPSAKDTRWSFVSRSLFNFACSTRGNISTLADSYWNARKNGKSLYLDAENAYKGSNNVSGSTPQNVVFMHVFRDSPFNYIDRCRIFADYIEWVDFTLRQIAQSNETWLLKPHPSSESWGESQVAWISSFSESIFDGKWPKNIVVDNKYSNIDILSKAKRVVTYNGTVHLEAACLGIRPIVIADVTLSNFDASLVHKPLTREQYSNLLGLSSNDPRFLLLDKSIQTSKVLLYIREKILPFSSDTGSYTVRRLDGEKAFIAEFNSVQEKMPIFVDNMILIGDAMASGLPHTVSLEYIEEWINFNKGE